MKCHILFSGKNKKNISKCRLLKILPRVLRVKASVDAARRTALLLDLVTYFLTQHDPISNLTDILSRTSL